MAFNYICSSLFVVIACYSTFTMAHPLNYLRDSDQSGFPYQNQFVYLRDNGANQVQSLLPVQSTPVNFINNFGSSQVQTVSPYLNAINNAGFVQVPNNVINSNFVNNVNNVNSVNSLSALQNPFVQTIPSIVNYPTVQPQYAVQQPAIFGGSAPYSNQLTTNTQTVPIEINYGVQGSSPYYC